MITCIANNIDYLYNNFFHAPQAIKKLKESLDTRNVIDVHIYIHADTLFGELYDHIQFGRDYDPTIFKERILKLLDNQCLPDKFMIATLFTIADTRFHDVCLQFGGFSEYALRFLFFNDYSECIQLTYKQCTMDHGGDNIIAIYINETPKIRLNKEKFSHKYTRPYLHRFYKELTLEDDPKRSLDGEFMVSYNVHIKPRK